jgi:hypothetical protein
LGISLSTPAATIGYVEAPDAERAIKEAIQESISRSRRGSGGWLRS